ncbi:MAG: RagB/SusD family nutrient uptake outer membrane protein [Candidatus Cryptobacteroides sp.]
MKNIQKISILLAAAGLLASGCIKETFPTGATQTKDQVAQQPSAIDGILNSIPSAMISTGTAGYLSTYGYQYDFGIGALHLATDNMLEDVATLGVEPGYNWFGTWAICKSQGSDYVPCAYFWDCYYPWIKSCNDVIGLVDPSTESATGQSQLGQALAYRAAFYLDLARLYLPKENKYIEIPEAIKGLTVPIITDKTSEQDASNNPRATREDMYEFILEDLALAEAMLKDKTLSYKTPNIGVVYGLLARAYLEMGADGDEGAYENAIKYADLAISTSGKTPLTKDQWQDPVNGFNNGGANDSWMWGIGCTSENVNNIVCQAAHLVMEAQWGYGPLAQLGINYATYQRINSADFRKASWLDEQAQPQAPLAGTAAEQDAFLNGNSEIAAAMPLESIKFRPAAGNCTNYTVGNNIDCLMMRVEEMWFIKMEALAKVGRLEEAKTLLKSFMDLRVLDGSYSTAKIADESSFINEMFFQKRVEFWGEGINIFDYKRLDKGITRGYEGTNHPAVFSFNCEGRSPQWNIVITRAETQSNKGIPASLNNPDPSQFVPLWNGK